jgi:hypothetical protein
MGAVDPSSSPFPTADRFCCVRPSSGGPELLVFGEAPSDRRGRLAERRDESSLGWLVDGDLVVSAAQVLDEGVSGGEYPEPGHGLDSAHRIHCHKLEREDMGMMSNFEVI